ncbi:MAG: hypothetical protein WC523_04565 [Patescibacteria group bacterium]
MTKRTSKIGSILVNQTCKSLREEFPDKLIATFVKLHDSGFSEKFHSLYIKEAKLFLKNKFEDKIEQGQLMVRLVKATFDLVKEAKNEEKEEKVKTKVKKTKGLDSDSGPLQETRGGKKQEEGTKQESVQEK